MAKRGDDPTTKPPAAAPAPDDVLIRTFEDARDELTSTMAFVLGDRDAALDAVQDAFVKCWRAKDQIPGVQPVRAWVFRVALNTAKDIRRSAWNRKVRQMDGEEYGIPGRPEEPGLGQDERDQLAKVRRAIADLRPEEQEVFLLRQNGELTYEDIAEQRGVPVGTVKTQMRAALMKLKKALGPGEPQDAEPERGNEEHADRR
jgi:RNA polymerase sigma-70 factor (ECF subfamily)